jgi:hypothetical protein
MPNLSSANLMSYIAALVFLVVGCGCIKTNPIIGGICIIVAAILVLAETNVI